MQNTSIRSQSPKAAVRGTPTTRADRGFIFAFVLLILAVQAMLLSPYMQSLIPHNPASTLREPSVSTPDYTDYRSTFSCLPTQTQSFCAIHTKYNFDVPSGDRGSFGILVADFNGDLKFLLNGSAIDPLGPVTVVQRLAFGMPTLVVFPDNLLKSGNNTLELTVSTDLPLGALIHRVYVGKTIALQRIFNVAFVQKMTLPRLVEGMLIATWIFAAYVVIRHKLTEYNSAFVFLTFMCLSILSIFAVDALTLELRVIPMFLRLSAGIIIGEVLAENRNGTSFVSMKYILLAPLSLALMMLQCDGAFEYLLVFQAFWMFLIGFSITGLIQKTRNMIMDKNYYEIFTITVATLAIGVSSANIVAVFGYLNSVMIGARGYVAIALVLIVAVKIFSTFSRHLKIVKSANDTLTNEMARVHEELNLIYFKDNALKQQMTVQLERERLMGDLHDGLAGNLISINALAEHGKPAVLDEIRRLSKLALLDLRLVVDSLDTFDGELAVALAAFKERITPQYSGTPAKISWDIEHAPIITALRPEVNLAIFRILQEAIANAVRHGKATRVHILVRASKCEHATASIWVLDNGTSSGSFTPGFGMRNMQRRADKIFGRVYFRLHKDGSAVLLNI